MNEIQEVPIHPTYRRWYREECKKVVDEIYLDGFSEHEIDYLLTKIGSSRSNLFGLVMVQNTLRKKSKPVNT